MIERFHDAPANLRNAILDQQCVAHDPAIADKICAHLRLDEFATGQILMKQDAEDRDLHFILAGRVSVQVNGREVATRQARQHVGEMALIDTAARRSASIIALEPTVTARIDEPPFTRIAGEHPELWRRLALELGNRLRERSKHVRPPNPRPVIFIASSREGLNIANEIQSGLSHDFVVPQVWTNNAFILGHGTMEDLEARITSADFGAVVCTPDDRVINDARAVDNYAPRDNVILELGMCLGALGRNRTFVILPRGDDLKLPTDLLGITPVDYTADDPTNLIAHLGPVSTAIRRVVQKLGPR